MERGNYEDKTVKNSTKNFMPNIFICVINTNYRKYVIQISVIV